MNDKQERLNVKQYLVYSNLYKKNIPLLFIEKTDGSFVLQHTGLKNFMLQMQLCARTLDPISITYDSIDTQLTHSIVNCTIAINGYAVTETGEAAMVSLGSDIAKMYPYLEAQKRAFDRAVISFLQLNLQDGKRIYSDSEL